jgi:hypothetical protein
MPFDHFLQPRNAGVIILNVPPRAPNSLQDFNTLVRCHRTALLTADTETPTL